MSLPNDINISLISKSLYKTDINISLISRSLYLVYV